MTGHEVIRTRQDYRDFLAADLQAHGFDRWNLETRLRSPELAYQRLLRLVEFSQTRRGPLGRALFVLHRVRLARRSMVTGISIPPGVFGRGLSVAHVGSVVVNDQVRVGRYCRIHSATNLGVYAGAAPTLGDFVYIGPGAVLYGAIAVGDRSVIGANSVVTGDVAGSVTVAGAPAKVIATKGSETVMPSSIVSMMSGDPARG